MFGKNKDMGPLLFEPQQSAIMLPDKKPVFVEFRGALPSIDEETNKLVFTERGPIWIQVDNIDAYYDNTVILFGNKVRVMETAAQIALKILEAMK